MNSIILLIVLAVLLVLGFLVEAFRHRANLKSIPIRVHVNGTRGKSSVTRLISAGLRYSGRRVCAKTTGTLARMIMPDGREYPVFRPAKANIIEQVRIVDTAASYKADALIIECMALLPHLQWLSESKMVRATHGVITNARADHLDVMGPGETDVAWALCGMVPLNGKLFTCERRHLGILQEAAADRRTELVGVTEEEVEAIKAEDMSGFLYVEHRENVALALKVLMDIGMDRESAIKGMWTAAPDPGAMKDFQLQFFGRKMIFINGFAANDPESTGRLWHMSIDNYPDHDKRVAIFNCRADRPDRSLQLAEACVSWKLADSYVLMGTGTYIFAKKFASMGVDSAKLVFAEDQDVAEVFETIVSIVGKKTLIVGMGNVAGIGLDLARYFANRGDREGSKMYG
jgi:poly-gamma-glutamate synthase PgsB/CapB